MINVQQPIVVDDDDVLRHLALEHFRVVVGQGWCCSTMPHGAQLKPIMDTKQALYWKLLSSQSECFGTPDEEEPCLIEEEPGKVCRRAARQGSEHLGTLFLVTLA